MPLLSKLTTGRHLTIVLVAWVGVLILAAVVLPPLDSHSMPRPAVYWSLLSVVAVLTLYSVIAFPAYLFQQWKQLRTVPNKLAYGTWLGFETIFLLAVFTILLYLTIVR